MVISNLSFCGILVLSSAIFMSYLGRKPSPIDTNLILKDGGKFVRL